MNFIRCVDYIYRFMFVLFFKQKTAYEMRISDWSSDVCSSDLGIDEPPKRVRIGDFGNRRNRRPCGCRDIRNNDPATEDEDQFSHQDETDQCPGRQVLQKSMPQLAEIDVEHHDDEKEQPRARTDLNADTDQNRKSAMKGKRV